ncbi:hypothetical protein C0995_004553 [Termitomyces sp. Mi166|nr:hypothetical protein C0995_004553 [Termitomyces sp. Mi166\
MPPRTRAHQTVENPPPEDAPAPTPKPPLPPYANTGGVFELPNEIWLEILSYFPSVRIPTLKISTAPLLSASTLEREHTLRALSQTCRTLRVVFLPELWKRFEVCATPRRVEIPSGTNFNDVQARVEDAPSSRQRDYFYLSGAWYKYIAEALERRSNGIRQSSDLAKYVQTVSVALTRCQAVTVLSAFVECLEALPNLHTLQILRAHTQMTTHLKNAFKDLKIPQVHTIVLPNHAHNVLRACPEVRVVMCNYDDGGKLIGAIMKECKKVQVLKGFHPDLNMMKRIVKGVPNLEEIAVECSDVVRSSLTNPLPLSYLLTLTQSLQSHPIPQKVIEKLSSLKHLRAIELNVSSQLAIDIPSGKLYTAELKACVSAAKNILVSKANGRDEKERKRMWLKLRYEASTHGKAMIEEVPLGLIKA